MHVHKNGLIWRLKKEELRVIVSKNYSFAAILREIGFKSWSANHYRSLKERLDFDNIDYSHIGNGAKGKVITRAGFTKDEALDFIFIEKSPLHQRTIRKYVIKYELLPYKCECGLENIWNNKLIVLQLDHKNGQNKDCRLQNLRWLCPNCHSQTATFGAKNIQPR